MLEESIPQKQEQDLETASPQHVTSRAAEVEGPGKSWHGKYLSEILLRPISLH